MAAKITSSWIAERIMAVIDQHFQNEGHITETEERRTRRLHYIGGILQTALFLLPLEKYEECKMYCYEKYGYDPGGCREQQMNIFELLAEDE